MNKNIVIGAGVGVLVIVLLVVGALIALRPNSNNSTTGNQTSTNNGGNVATKEISAAELAKNNTLQSCYTSYRGDVYDLTSFIPEHPGGADILQYCGKVIDESFVHPGGSFSSPKVQRTIGSLKIGVLKN